MNMKDTKQRRKNIYINPERERKMDAVFAHMQAFGMFGPDDRADDNVTVIIDFALNKAMETIDTPS
jgi:hypothetical protein